MSHENWLAAGLASIIALILALTGALTWNLGWSLLAISTLLTLLLYPMIWLAWRYHRFWSQSLMQLTTYSQTLKEGSDNIGFKRQHADNLLLDLQREIAALASSSRQQKQQKQLLDNILGRILDAWPIPVCLFDETLHLSYRNAAMNEQLQQPMLLGTAASAIGFTQQGQTLQHGSFDQNWQCQTIRYQYQGQTHWLFSALNVSQRLQQAQSVTQQNLVRVLGHELRNSLTPMESMADTLLSSASLDESQTRMVLQRIQQRSKRLLSFIDQYSQLSQLSKPKMSWFDIGELLDEAKALLGQDCSIELLGNSQCYGDVVQVSQVLLNLVKNAREACAPKHCMMQFKVFFQQQQQIIECSDNGPGFANLHNVLTPFYTTKQHGSGIGLSLCAEIANNHGGRLKVDNQPGQGAKIILSWPIERQSNKDT